MKRYILPVLCFFVLICLHGCKKEIGPIGLDLQEGDYLLGSIFTDTSTVTAYSILDDSIKTGLLTSNVLGYINDPIFGVTQAGFYSQFRLGGNNVDFGSGSTIDSLVLTLQYTGYFADTLSPVNIKVYELSEDLVKSASNYYCSTVTANYGQNLTYNANFTVAPRPTTSIVVGFDTAVTSPHMRIRLSDQFGADKFLSSQARLANNTEFLEYFKGLYIVGESASGAGNYSYINPLKSSLVLYYTTASSEKKKYTFSITSDCGRYNYYNHFDYNNADQAFKNQVLNQNPSLGEKTLYAQPTGGVKTKIKIPYIRDAFKDKNIVINKAELVVTNISPSDAYFFMPYQIGLQQINDDNTISFFPDEISMGTTYFGGTYDASKKEYRFRITKYVQNLIKGTTNNNGMYLVVSSAGIIGNRLIFCGPNPDAADVSKRLRLEVYYTTF